MRSGTEQFYQLQIALQEIGRLPDLEVVRQFRAIFNQTLSLDRSLSTDPHVYYAWRLATLFEGKSIPDIQRESLEVCIDDYTDLNYPNALHIPLLRPCIGIAFYNKRVGKGRLIHFLLDKEKFLESLESLPPDLKDEKYLEIVVRGGRIPKDLDKEMQAKIYENRCLVNDFIKRMTACSIDIQFNDSQKLHQSLSIDSLLGGVQFFEREEKW